jgi:hypothetical protein
MKIKKPRNFRTAFQKVKSDAERNHNITFDGNERSGKGSGYGFTAEYTVDSDYIRINVKKKPILLSEVMIRRTIEEYCEGL